jgi:glycosyltransferase involved in cell wall biosynthesis
MNPRVSVIVTAHESERTIGAAVSSVLSQSYESLELVVVDDGSSDATADIVGSHTGPIELIRQEAAGVAAARNAGVLAARGELITFCDSDDLLFEGHVQALVERFDAWPGGLVSANALYLYPGGVDPRRRRYKGAFPAPESQRTAILEQNFVSIQTLFPRALFEEIGPFRPEKKRAEDWDFWMRAIYRGYRVGLQPRPLALIRIRPESLSADVEAMESEVELVLENVDRELSLTREEIAYVERRRSSVRPQQLGRSGDEALRAKRYHEAAKLYRDAAALTSSERRLVWKARLMSVAPRIVGPVVRRRQVRLERDLGIHEGHVR